MSLNEIAIRCGPLTKLQVQKNKERNKEESEMKTDLHFLNEILVLIMAYV